MPSRPRTPATPTPLAHACVVGLGNIGSQLVALLARSGSFGSLTLVDPDVYDEGNRWTQNIRPAHVGMEKAEAQAIIAHTINPGMRVTPICAAVEDVPLGQLRADVIFSAPDTRRARQHVNRIAWRLGVGAWIDAGIDPSAHFVRVSLYAPRESEPCLECAWGPDDYAVAGDHFPCAEAVTEAAPRTNGPPALGALAAARAVLLCDQHLTEGPGHAGMQLTLAVREHRLAVTRFRRNPACRFDHGALPAGPPGTVPLTMTLGEFDTWIAATEQGGPWHLSVDGCSFGTRVFCAGCGRTRDGLRLVRPSSGVALRCDCGARLGAAPLDTVSRIGRADLTRQPLALSLGDLGLQAADIITIASGDAVRSVEIADAGPGDLAGGHAAASCDHARRLTGGLR